MIKKLAKILLWVFGSLIGLLLLISVLVYIPPIQNFIKSQASSFVSNSMNMQLDVERFRLKFPLRLAIDNTILVTPGSDTLVGFKKLEANISPLPLLRGKVKAYRVSVSCASVDYRDTLSGLTLKGTLEDIVVRSAHLELKNDSVHIAGISLSDAVIDMGMGESRQPVDTAEKSPALWKIAGGELDLRNIDFRLNLETQNSTLTALLEDADIRDVYFDMGQQLVEAGLVRISDGNYSFVSTADNTAVPDEETTEESSDTPQWQIEVRRVELENNGLVFQTAEGEAAPGFDPAHIAVTELGLTVDSVKYKGDNISAYLRNLSLKERSGIEITGAHGGFVMDSSQVVLSGFELKTPNSDINAELRAALTVLQLDSSAPVTAKINASVGPQDVFLFYTPTTAVRQALSGRSVEITGDIEGELNDIKINTLTAVLPGSIDFKADGRVASLLEPENMTGNLNVAGTFTNIDFVKGFLADSLRNRIGFPDMMTLNGNVVMTGTVYSPNLRLTADGGILAVDGRLDTRAENYRAEVSVHEFPLYEFLPADSLGLLEMKLTAEGSGFDFGADGTNSTVELDISRFDYMGYQYHGIGLDASLLNHILTGNIHSDLPPLNLNLDVTGKLYPGNYSASLNGRIANADLRELHLSAEPLSVRTAIMNASFEMTPDTAYIANLTLDSAVVTFGKYIERIPRTTVTASSDNEKILASVRSGDLTLDFNSPVSLDSLTRSLAGTMDEINRLVAERGVHMNELQEAMPPFKLDIEAGTNNVLHTIMETQGVGFRHASASVTTLDSRPLFAGIVIDELSTGSLTLDTLNVGFQRRDDSLSYYLRLANRPGNIEEMALILVYGKIYGPTANANFFQRNRAGRTGFQFGLDATLLDSAVRVSLTPLDPLFGYRKWTANPDNYVMYSFNRELSADLRLDGDNQHFHIVSDELPGLPSGVVRLDMTGIDIGELLSLLPSPPGVDGILASDIKFGFDRDIFAVNGNVSVDSLSYDKRLIGDIGARVALQGDSVRQRLLDGAVSVNGTEALTAKGTLASFGEKNMNLTIGIPGVPLELVNPFAPEDMLRLAGELHGGLKITGDLSDMDIDGELYFTDASATIPMAGTSYRIADDHIIFNNSRVIFDDFGLIAPNDEKLSIDGTVDISDFSRLNTDLEIFAEDFQWVSSTWQQGAQVYGRADTDIDITVKGYTDELQVRGNIDILNSTDVTYIMRDSPLEVDDQKQDIVTFVSFADTARLRAMDSVARLRPSFGVDVSVNVDIADGVQATVNLSEDGNNRIELIGEGSLSFSMSNQGDIRLAGRYDLTGGTVMYNPPIISQKVFAIQPDSYVSWTGDPVNPSFNIKATQALRTTVTKSNNTTSNVTFNVTIIIANTLQDMSLTFDLSAPGDSEVGSELASLTPEQRSDQALALMIYNTYTGPGTTAKVDVNNPLNAFIERELNQWARNSLPGVDLSLGIKDVDDADGGQHVDYSYSVSKTLFNDRVKVTVGGTLNSAEASAGNAGEDIVQDFELEYRLTDRDNMFLKLYRHNTQPSILEGEVTETGGGFVVRKKMNRLRELFRFSRSPETKKLRQQQREARRAMREQEKAAGVDPAGEQQQEDPAILNNDSQNDIRPLE